MDEFDFEDSPTASDASSILSSTKRSGISSNVSANNDAFSLSGSPPRGRTKKRKSRQVLRTGAQALAARNREVTASTDVNVDCGDKNDEGTADEKCVNSDGHAETPTAASERSSQMSSIDNSATSSTNNSANSSKPNRYGRRRKKSTPKNKSKGSSDTSSHKEWDGTDDFVMGTPESVVDRILNRVSDTAARRQNDQSASHSGNRSFGSGTNSAFSSSCAIRSRSDRVNETTSYDMNTPGTPPTPTPPRYGSNSDSNRVRFSLSSNTRHYYGTPESDEKFCGGSRIEIKSSQSSLSSGSSTSDCVLKSEDELDEIGEIKPSTDKESSVLKSEQFNSEVVDTSSTQMANTHQIANEQCNQQSAHPNRFTEQKSILKSKKRNIAATNSPLSSPAKSTGSYGSTTSYASLPKRRRFFGHYTENYTSSDNLMDNGMYHSNSPETIVTLGRRNIQDAGSYRMMIDDLSYLCSAILGCRRKTSDKINSGGRNGQNMEVRHTPVTVGAACDLAESISQSEMRMALLVLGSQKKDVGALSAVLEAVACAPLNYGDWRINVCREMIGGGQLNSEDQKRSAIVDDVRAKSEKPAGRTKSARRKQSVIETDMNMKPHPDNATTSSVSKPQVKNKHDIISSKALSLVAHFVSAICTYASYRQNPQINRAAVKSARNAVLGHKTALRGLARLVLDDPVVDAYLAQRALIVHGRDNATVDKTVDAEDIVKEVPDDQSDVSHLTSNSKVSKTSTLSEPKKEDVESISGDPTKFGRRKGRKKRLSRLQRAMTPSSTSLQPISEIEYDTDRSFGKLSCTPEEANDAEKKTNLNGFKEKNDKSDSLSFASDDVSNISRDESTTELNNETTELKSGTKYQEKIASALSRANLSHSLGQALLASDLNASQDYDDWTCSYCSTWERHVLNNSYTSESSDSPLTSASIALDAADRIISGRDKSNPQHADGDEDHSDEDESDDNFLDAEKPHDTTKNPILFANEMMRKSGSLIEYSKSMTSTIASLLLALRHTALIGDLQPKKCYKCITYLQYRASTLSGVIDNLCCLSPEVSKSLCLPESLLIPSLLLIISESQSQTLSQSSLDELVTIALKTLTTLTHENSSACDQILSYYCASENGCKLTNGVEVVFLHLYNIVTEQPDHKSSYDSTIFCLNILTNVAEMIPTPTRAIFLDMLIDKELKGITWLTEWLMSKTLGFRQAVMKGSFGTTTTEECTNESHDDELKSGEESNLVTAGNGFVLLAYLMLDDDNATATTQMRETVIKELPVDETGKSGGILFMIKTLKAFCNFYHYSVGDLSVAVIAPVIKLISGLERINLIEKRPNWL